MLENLKLAGITEEMLEAKRVAKESERYLGQGKLCDGSFADESDGIILCELDLNHSGDHKCTLRGSNNSKEYLWWPEIPDDKAPVGYLKRKYAMWGDTDFTSRLLAE